MHPHFLDYLRYFIYGAKLPDQVVSAFVASVKACGFVTSSDVASLAATAHPMYITAQIPGPITVSLRPGSSR
jgi:hypothetical protein